MEASPIGTVRPCCLADHELCDDAGNKFELATASFDTIRHSSDMQTLRQQFLDGVQPETCRRCWAEEDSGRTSKRMHTLERLKHIVQDQPWTVDARPLMFLDLKLGNICNLKCRICGSWSSSQYATEELQALPSDQRRGTFHHNMLRAGAWPRSSPQFWQEIENNLSDIRYIEFTGGEPFLIAEHFAMLQGIVNRGIAQNVEIHYNTNGTVFPEQAAEIWRHFRTVEVAFSIDDLGARFEYQRTNARWHEVEHNIRRFQDLKHSIPGLRLQCCTTVNVFNICYLDQVARWIVTQDFDFVYWNMMHDAWYFSIASLPEKAKQGIRYHLRNAQIPDQYREEFDRIVDFMTNGATDSGRVLRDNIRLVDQRRNQNLCDVAPELAFLIDYDKT